MADIQAAVEGMGGLDIQGGEELAAKFKASLAAPQLARVEALEKLQGQFGDLYGQFVKERQELEAKYEKMYEPLYAERADIVSGKKEVPGGEAGGLEGFWLRCLQMNDMVSELITEKDVEVLKHLKDLKYENLPDDSGFKLIFTFEANDFFDNTVLEKTYYLVEEDYEPVLEKAEGTQINWKAGKDVTVKVMKKKPKKGAKASGPPQTKLEPCDSFFNFFKPPTIPDDEEDLDDDEAEELQAVVEADYEVGAIIKEKVIPHAVDWYTGKAVSESMLLWGGDEDIMDDEDEDEDESEEGEGAAEGEKPAECKQQ